MKDHLLLINPAVSLESQSALVNSMINKSLPTSLGVLAAYVLDSGLTTVKIVDEQIHFLDDRSLEKAVLELDAPRIVGLSVMFDTMYANLSFYLSFAGLKRMLKSSFAGGNVVKLNRRGYLQPKSVLRMSHLAFYLTRRFLVVFAKMVMSRIIRSGSDQARPSLEVN